MFLACLLQHCPCLKWTTEVHQQRNASPVTASVCTEAYPSLTWTQSHAIFWKLSANKERVPVGAYQPFLLSYKNNQWQCPFHPAGLSRPATWHPTLIPMLASELAVLLLSLATLTSVSILVVAKLATRTPATQAHLNMALELDSLWWVSFVLSD